MKMDSHTVDRFCGRRRIDALLVCALALCLVLFSGCDLHYEYCPQEQANSVWICEEPYIEIQVDDHQNLTSYLGQGNDREEIVVLFGPGTRIDFEKMPESATTSYEDPFLFRGYCIFSPDQMTVEVDLELDRLFEGEYRKLVFYRQQESFSVGV